MTSKERENQVTAFKKKALFCYNNGIKLGWLRLLRKRPTRFGDSEIWTCMCRCGALTESKVGRLMVGKKTSCGCMAHVKYLLVYNSSLTSSDLTNEIIELKYQSMKINRILKEIQK